MILVVGEAPSKWMKEREVSEPLPLARRELAQLAGLSLVQFNQKFECINLLKEWPGKQGKGDAFPMDLARAAAARVKLDGRRAVFLGQRVAAAFYIDIPILQWRTASWGETAISPHPSHVNRWWNLLGNKQQAARFWGEAADSTGNVDPQGSMVGR